MSFAPRSSKVGALGAAARRVVLIYAAFAALWIVVSDTALEALLHDPTQQTLVQMVKGLLFVAVTTLLLYVLVSRLLKSINETRLALGAHYATLIEQARDIVLLIGPDGRIVDANRAAEEAYGWHRTELLAMTVGDLRAPGDQANLTHQWAAAASTQGVLFEACHRRRDGRVFPVEVSSRGVEIEGKCYRQSFIRDITERTQAETNLADSEERLRLATDQAGVAVWEYDFSTNTMARSGNHDKLYGLDWQEKWDINTFLAATHPDDRGYSNQIIRNSVAPGGPDDYSFDFRVVCPDKSIRWLSVKGRVLERKEGGQGIRVRGTLIDVTERKQSVAELTQRNAELERFNRASVNRELDMIALKERVNALSIELARTPPFAPSAVHIATTEVKQ